jgi:hypothetical protein
MIMEINFSVLRQTSMNHETGETAWTGLYRGRQLFAELALIHEPVRFNGEKTAPEDDIYLPELRRSDLALKVPAARTSFTLKNHYSFLAADSRHPAEESFQWGPLSVGRSLVIVVLPKDGPRGCLLLGAIRGGDESERENILSSALECSIDELASHGIITESDDGNEPYKPGIAALRARLEAHRVYYEELIERACKETVERAGVISA